MPPRQGRAKKIEEDVRDYLKQERESVFKKEKNSEKRSNTRQKRQGRSIWFPISIGGGVVLLVLGVYLFFKLPKADVAIWPKVDVLSFEHALTADESVGLTDITEFVIPAKNFEISKTLSKEFQATGNASDEGKASGSITVYNKYSPAQSITFRAGTHFLSDSGKLFRAAKRIVIPAAKESGGKVTPGSAQVEVEAVEGGDSYNISASNFSVPGLKGTAYYYSVYATSDSAMSGGYTGEIKKVTDGDIQSAEDALLEELISQAKQELKDQINSDYVLLDEAISSEVIDKGAETDSGAVVNSFKYEATVELYALSFKKSDIEEFAKKYIISEMPEEKTLLESSLITEYSADSVDYLEGTIALNLSFSCGTYKSIDKNSVSLSLPNKNAEQIRDAISGILGDDLSKVEVKFWPFWVAKAPKSQKAINVSLKFD